MESYEQLRQRQLRENRTIKDFHKKLDELYGELKEVILQLNQKINDKDQIIECIGKLQKEEKSIEIVKDSLSNEVNKLVSDREKEKDKKQKEISKYSEIVDNLKNDITKFTKERNQVLLSLNDISQKKIKLDGKLKESEKKFQEITDQLQKLEREFITLQKKKKDIEIEMGEQISKLSIERKEIDEMTKKNSKILIQSERNLRILEQYVKRLQRYYDQNGIRLNILKQFGIELK